MFEFLLGILGLDASADTVNQAQVTGAAVALLSAVLAIVAAGVAVWPKIAGRTFPPTSNPYVGLSTKPGSR